MVKLKLKQKFLEKWGAEGFLVAVVETLIQPQTKKEVEDVVTGKKNTNDVWFVPDCKEEALHHDESKEKSNDQNIWIKIGRYIRRIIVLFFVGIFYCLFGRLFNIDFGYYDSQRYKNVWEALIRGPITINFGFYLHEYAF